MNIKWIAISLYVIGIIFIMIGSSGCGNLQNDPVEVEVDPVHVYHDVEVSPAKLEKLYKERCTNDIDCSTFATQSECDLAIDECVNTHVTDFFDVLGDVGM